MASPAVISALDRALALSHVLKHAPGTPSTHNADVVMAELTAAVAADPFSALPEAQVGTLQQLLTSGDAVQVTLASKVLVVLLLPGARSSISSGGARLCQVRAQ
jgi:hypothetical protein